MITTGCRIAIASGKGGTGKTMVAVNLMYSIKDIIDGKIQLIDCDVEEPNINIFTKGRFNSEKEVAIKIPEINTDKCIYCGKCAEYCSYNAIIFVKSIPHIAVMDDLCHGCGACSYACETKDAITEKNHVLGTVSKYNISDKIEIIEGRIKVGNALAVPVIKAVKKEANENALVIYDSPPGTSCPVIETINDVDYVVLVTEPTPFGVNDLKLMVETVKKLGKKMGVVVNRIGLGTDDLYDYLNAENIEVLMKIPFDKKIAGIYSEGKILVDEFPWLKQEFLDLFKKIHI